MTDPGQALITVSGHVQGVFYRAFTSRIAKSLGLRGYARNLPRKNAVEVCVEGEKDKIEEFILQLKEGPPEALVENVETTWSNFSGQYNNFEVRS
jgi:acylphosphatase